MNQLKCVMLLGLAALAASADINWDDLKTTWGTNPFGNYFNHQPRTVDEATQMGFTLKDNFCASGDSTNTFRGQRYWKNSDSAVILIYDASGYIAGIQSAVASSVYTPSAANQNTMFQQDGQFWTVTVYFTHPSKICVGRTQDEFDLHGTLDNGLWIQIGPDPEKDLDTVPVSESAISSDWTKGICFPTMGTHYWRFVDAKMNCNQWSPLFLIYSGKTLAAIGFAFDADLPSPNYEKPPHISLPSFMGGDVPRCISDAAHLSTMHTFFTGRPYLTNLCLPFGKK